MTRATALPASWLDPVIRALVSKVAICYAFPDLPLTDFILALIIITILLFRMFDYEHHANDHAMGTRTNTIIAIVIVTNISKAWCLRDNPVLFIGPTM